MQKAEMGGWRGLIMGRCGLGLRLPIRGSGLPAHWSIYTRQDLTGDAGYFRRLVLQEQIAGFVVGLPVHLDGRESQKSIEARAVRPVAAGNHRRERGVF